MANLSQPMSFAAIAALDAVENRTVSSNAESDVSHTNPVESSIASNVVSNPNDKSEELLKAMNDDLGLDDGDDGNTTGLTNELFHINAFVRLRLL